MFSFFKPKPKLFITEEDRLWLESNLHWLKGQFGTQPFLRPPVTKAMGPFARYHNALREAMRYFFDEVCVYMDVDTDTVDLHLYEPEKLEGTVGGVVLNAETSGSLGEYHHRNNVTGKFDIHLNLTITSSLDLLLYTMAHELSHLRLIGEGRHSPAEETHEYVTDLTAIYFGFGVMMANSIHPKQDWRDARGNEGWAIGKAGYLPMEVVTHALALQAFERKEENPSWAIYLNKPARKMFRSALLYLFEQAGKAPKPTGERAPADH